MRRLSLLPLAVVVAITSACAGGPVTAEAPRVVVTTSILADLVEAVAGEAAQVDVLIEAGQDEHSFQASPQQVRAVAEADLIVAFGLGLEAGLSDVLTSSGGDRLLEIGPLVDPIPVDEHHDGEEESEHASEEESHGPDDGHGHEGFDPHVWLDPVRMGAAIEPITDALLEVVPEQWHDGVRERATTVVTAVADAHATAEDMLAGVPDERRLLVSDHEALSYFAERYGFRLIGSLLPGTSTDASASAADVAALAERVRELGVPAVFVDAAASDRLARALAAEVSGLQVVPLFVGSLGPEGSDASTYTDLVVENARRVAEALS